VKKVAPKPAPQDPKKPLMMQKDIELAMQEFFQAQWIKADPGKPDEIADDKSLAAVKDFQKLFGLDHDGMVGKNTRDAIQKQLPACHRQSIAEDWLGQLFRGGKLTKDSGPVTGVNDDETKAAVEEFQGNAGLKKTGVPDADTLKALEKAVLEHKPSPSKQGLNPQLEALFWLGNRIPPGGSGHLRLQSADLKHGQSFKVFIKGGEKNEEVDSKVALVSNGDKTTVTVPIPATFATGSQVVARIEGTLEGGKKAELSTAAPLYVRGIAGPIEPFFKLNGSVGEGKRDRKYTYVAYKVQGKPQAWFMKGRFMTDVDGAPNCYHPKDLDVRLDYLSLDLMKHKGALDWKRNGGHPGNWFGVVTDDGKNTGNPVVQGDKDPCPGFYVSSTSLHGPIKDQKNPARYVDARQIPYLAFNYQVYAEAGGRFERVTKGATGRLGDILTAVNMKADEKHRFAHAVFADVGGRDNPHFGEGSPALGQKVQAAGIAEPGMFFIIYPHSGADQGTIPTADEIHEKGEKLFSEWGGMAEVERVLGLMPKE
jgi:peptidoglycan hydrolase-like protein with peptidoglycan-binding domain